MNEMLATVVCAGILTCPAWLGWIWFAARDRGRSGPRIDRRDTY